MKTRALAVWTAFAVAASVALAAAPPAARADGRPPLPPEAYAACDSKTDGSACSVKIFEREISGTCVKDQDGSRLFCRPNELPPPPPGHP